uniref:Phosphoglycerate kinase n=1 Tax=Chromera velia CCMP2878 TaxID=1169474 RepID=A0A0G4HRH7_9ALVE|eukprot:Cvel_1290.t1-p1 / transcript=Cvel_1290.t1 / gene=Cvel_1290 / organism=Chromera_velia_CCMP2878 / gene_product=hypothetical protein / transcript_product=hypothetical protein / location=Cvel_scaffold43:106503-119268(-) / protein_length=1785 / sequence_SO=supercontig / SO=protein_coding / is_pseudo=false
MKSEDFKSPPQALETPSKIFSEAGASLKYVPQSQRQTDSHGVTSRRRSDASSILKKPKEIEHMTVQEKLEISRDQRILDRFASEEKRWERFRKKASEKTQRRPDELAITRAEEHREKMETFDLLDAAVPAKDRPGPDWYASLRNGDTTIIHIGGIWSGLTLNRKTKPTEVKRIVRKPWLRELHESIQAREAGETPSVLPKDRLPSALAAAPPARHGRTWRDIDVLVDKLTKYKSRVEACSPGRLALNDFLEVKGSGINPMMERSYEEEGEGMEENLRASGEMGEGGRGGNAEGMEDGMALLKPYKPGGSFRTAKTTEHEEELQEGPFLQMDTEELIFSARVGSVASKVVRLENRGTAVLVFEWSMEIQERRVPWKDVEQEEPPRLGGAFTCAQPKGRILPGASALISFAFQGAVPGCFSESWQADRLKEGREELSENMRYSSVVRDAKEITNEVVGGVKRRPPPPPDLSDEATQRKVFEDCNASLGLKHSNELFARFLDTAAEVKELVRERHRESFRKRIEELRQRREKNHLLCTDVSEDTTIAEEEALSEWVESDQFEPFEWDLSVPSLISHTLLIPDGKTRREVMQRIGLLSFEALHPGIDASPLSDDLSASIASAASKIPQLINAARKELEMDEMFFLPPPVASEDPGFFVKLLEWRKQREKLNEIREQEPGAAAPGDAKGKKGGAAKKGGGKKDKDAKDKEDLGVPEWLEPALAELASSLSTAFAEGFSLRKSEHLALKAAMTDANFVHSENFVKRALTKMTWEQCGIGGSVVFLLVDLDLPQLWAPECAAVLGNPDRADEIEEVLDEAAVSVIKHKLAILKELLDLSPQAVLIGLHIGPSPQFEAELTEGDVASFKEKRLKKLTELRQKHKAEALQECERLYGQKKAAAMEEADAQAEDQPPVIDEHSLSFRTECLKEKYSAFEMVRYGSPPPAIPSGEGEGEEQGEEKTQQAEATEGKGAITKASGLKGSGWWSTKGFLGLVQEVVGRAASSVEFLEHEEWSSTNKEGKEGDFAKMIREGRDNRVFLLENMRSFFEEAGEWCSLPLPGPPTPVSETPPPATDGKKDKKDKSAEPPPPPKHVLDGLAGYRVRTKVPLASRLAWLNRTVGTLMRPDLIMNDNLRLSRVGLVPREGPPKVWGGAQGGAAGNWEAVTGPSGPWTAGTRLLSTYAQVSGPSPCAALPLQWPTSPLRVLGPSALTEVKAVQRLCEDAGKPVNGRAVGEFENGVTDEVELVCGSLEPKPRRAGKRWVLSEVEKRKRERAEKARRSQMSLREIRAEGKKGECLMVIGGYNCTFESLKENLRSVTQTLPLVTDIFVCGSFLRLLLRICWNLSTGLFPVPPLPDVTRPASQQESEEGDDAEAEQRAAMKAAEESRSRKEQMEILQAWTEGVTHFLEECARRDVRLHFPPDLLCTPPSERSPTASSSPSGTAPEEKEGKTTPDADAGDAAVQGSEDGTLPLAEAIRRGADPKQQKKNKLWGLEVFPLATEPLESLLPFPLGVFPQVLESLQTQLEALRVQLEGNKKETSPPPAAVVEGASGELPPPGEGDGEAMGGKEDEELPVSPTQVLPLIPPDCAIVDIGPASLDRLKGLMDRAGSVIWMGGPLGAASCGDELNEGMDAEGKRKLKLTRSTRRLVHLIEERANPDEEFEEPEPDDDEEEEEDEEGKEGEGAEDGEGEGEEGDEEGEGEEEEAEGAGATVDPPDLTTSLILGDVCAYFASAFLRNPLGTPGGQSLSTPQRLSNVSALSFAGAAGSELLSGCAMLPGLEAAEDGRLGLQ